MRSSCFREYLVDGLSEEIADCLKRGCGIARVQRALTELSFELGVDEQAALWLFAWCYDQALAGRFDAEEQLVW